MKNINEERIEINEFGICETFEAGISQMYKDEEARDSESTDSMATLGDINSGGTQEN